ncbi:MAG: hypothetical protein J5529_11505 [Prevotella sp.]|nr:hypothetical protein [Prevotella sp.]
MQPSTPNQLVSVLLISNQVRNAEGVGNPIIERMTRSLNRDKRISTAHFEPFLKGNTVASLRRIAKEARRHDVAHVHFGGLYALLVRLALAGSRKPTLITFHGTDIHAKAVQTASSKLEKIKIRLNQWASFACILLYGNVGFVAGELKAYVPSLLRKRLKRRSFTQLLGVDYETFFPMEQGDARGRLGLGDGRLALFSDISRTNVKRRDLAEKITSLLDNTRLLVMSGVKAEETPLWVNACDILLLTSDEEGSPNIIRECLALNKRVFSVDVGDARQQLHGLSNSMVISRDPETAARQIEASLQKPYTDNTRDCLRSRLDIDLLNNNVVNLYQRVSHHTTKHRSFV